MADKKGPQSAKDRFLGRLKSKGFDVEKKHLYWSHEAKALKKAIDAYKGTSPKASVTETEAAVWKLIRARGPLALQRAKHAEARYSARLAAVDAIRSAQLKKERQQKQADREKMGYRPAMENYLLEKAKATYCGRCGTTHVPPKFGGTCPALKKEEKSLYEISSELIARYKEKAKKQADELEANKQFRKATDRRMGIFRATGKQIEKTTANIKKALGEEIQPIDELKKATIASYVKKASKDARIKSMVAKDMEHRSDTSRKSSKKMAFSALAADWKKKAWKREDNVNKAVDRLTKEDTEQVHEISTMAHMRYQEAARKNIKDTVPHMSGEYGDIAKRIVDRRMKGLTTSSGLKLRDYLAKARKITNEEAGSTVHPNALHVQPVKVGGQQKYKVHAVGKNFASGIKKGEHLTDTELDDFTEMGGKIKHIKENVMKKLREIMEEMKRGRGRPRKNPAPAAKHDSDDEHEYGPSARPASREGSSSHIVQQLASAAHDDLPKKGRDVDFKHHTGFVPQHVAQKAIHHYSSLKRSEDKANWAADHYEMHHKDFVKKFS